jgi:tRNA(Ile)-lysidine synthase
MLPAGTRVIAAVSSGADSVCLLHVLHELAPHLTVTLAGVAHLNHKQRGAESDADETFVAELAGRLGLKFFRAEGGSREGNLEQAMRRARREFFTRLIGEGACDRVAVAHTRDDQAETVLFRVLRGSGLKGLSGIHPVTSDGLIRPLIGVGREDAREFLRARGVTWREDSSNRDSRFARNRIRGTLLPELARDWNPNIAEALAQLGDLAWEEERWWDAELARLGTGAIATTAGGVEMDLGVVNKLPRAVARRLVRETIVQAKGDARQIEFGHVERVLDLMSKAEGNGRLRLPGLEIRRSFDRVRFAAPETAGRHKAVEVEIPGCCEAPDGGSRIHFELGEKGAGFPCDTLRVELSWPRIRGCVEVRGWQPGDHYRPLGERRDQKIKDLFQKLRVPSWRRRGWPIVTSDGKILWARGFGAATEFAAKGAGPVLQIWETVL